MSRQPYKWGAKQYLASFEKGEIRQYDGPFPWRSLASIASRMGKQFGMLFSFRRNKAGTIKLIERVL